MENILSLHDVTKIYNNRRVVNNASFDIQKGTVCGLLGPNGAGKTTIMKMIMNQVKCDEGYIEYDKNLKIKYLQDVPNFYEFYTVKEYLNFLLDISHYEKDKEYRINEVLKFLDLSDYIDHKISKLSRGLRQKVGIASVIVDEPDVLIMDEPVSALDPIGRKEIFDTVNALRGKVTIIFSSHILTDIERVCDYVVLINKGKIIVSNEIKNMFSDKQTIQVEFKSREDLLKIKDKLEYENSFSDSIENCLEINYSDVNVLEKDIFELLIKEEVLVKSVLIKKDNLEEIFLREVKNNA